MSQPVTLALVLALLGALQAHAQPAHPREPRQRTVALSGNPLEVRIAKGTRTVLVLGVPIRGQAIEVDRALIHIVDTGEHSVIIEPLSEPLPEERWTLRVPLADGKSPEQVEFVLVSHPSEVDTELDVAGRAPPDAACQDTGAPCAAMTPADAVEAGLIDSDGVLTLSTVPFIDSASGFEARASTSYRAGHWVLVEVELIVPPEHPAWTASRATLTSRTGEVRVRAVKVVPSKQYPGQKVRLLVEGDAPPPSAGIEFVLYLYGADGAPPLSISAVKLPPAKENTP